MSRLLLPSFATVLLSCAIGLLSIPPALSQEQAKAKYKFDVPPSANLSYAIKARQQGLSVEGNATVRWNTSGNKFVVTNETRAMLVGKILDTKSEGLIDAHGLAPLSSTEKRFRKEPTTATFDRAAQVISFTNSENTYPIKGGEQDRTSAVWQLISIARAAPAKFKAGSEWSFFVAGQRSGEPWTFKVVNKEKTRTGTGELDTVHVLREQPPGSKEQQLDIWLAPSLEWYPVRLRFSEADGDFIDQTLTQADKKS